MGKKVFLVMLMALPVTTFITMKSVIADAEENTEEATKEVMIGENSGASETMADPKDDYVAMRAGGIDIMHSELMRAMRPYFSEGELPEISEFPAEMQLEVAKKLAFQKLVTKKAREAGLDQTESFQARMETLENQMLMEIYLREQAEAAITEDKIKALYQEKIAEMGGTEEVKASHILVATEDEAKEILTMLRAGGDFAEIAREKSKDPGSKAKGGDLGYFTKDRMVEAFADAAFALEPGKLSEPVETDFGWHIIKVEDKRTTPPPSLEELRPQLETVVKQEFLANYFDQTLGDEPVQFFNADGTPRELKPESPEAGGMAAEPSPEQATQPAAGTDKTPAMAPKEKSAE